MAMRHFFLIKEKIDGTKKVSEDPFHFIVRI
jgi:hypothetical protein